MEEQVVVDFADGLAMAVLHMYFKKREEDRVAV